MKMTMDGLMEMLPSYSKDMKLNFSSVVSNQTDLNEQQLWGTVVACAMTSRNEDLTATALEEASSHLSSQALEAAKSAAAVMGMNNIYYRFLHPDIEREVWDHASRAADERYPDTRSRASGF